MFCIFIIFKFYDCFFIKVIFIIYCIIHISFLYHFFIVSIFIDSDNCHRYVLKCYSSKFLIKKSNIKRKNYENISTFILPHLCIFFLHGREEKTKTSNTSSSKFTCKLITFIYFFFSSSKIPQLIPNIILWHSKSWFFFFLISLFVVFI